MLPVVFGISGKSLTEEERELFLRVKPQGYIIFARNIESREQLKSLTDSLRSLSGEVDIYIDQEGGRVRRLKPPLFRECPSAGSFVDLVSSIGLEGALREVYNNYFQITKDLLEFGINVNCAPVADLFYPDADIVIGDRSFGNDLEIVILFCKKVMDAISDAGGKYIIKHIPGHGRAKVDSHFSLPVVDTSLSELEETDFKVFKSLSSVGAGIAMTAHIIYSSLDEQYPATISKKVINYIRAQIGFKGKIITDAIEMKALTSILNTEHKEEYNSDLGIGEHLVSIEHTSAQEIGKLAKLCIESGCDIVLHCNGNLLEMQNISDAIINLKPEVQI